MDPPDRVKQGGFSGKWSDTELGGGYAYFFEPVSPWELNVWY